MEKDTRQEDESFLNEHGCHDFGLIWEEELHRVEHGDRNQERWHLARMSMLAGFLLAEGESAEEVVEELSSHRDGFSHKP